jgi:hypothetical protein
VRKQEKRENIPRKKLNDSVNILNKEKEKKEGTDREKETKCGNGE